MLIVFYDLLFLTFALVSLPGLLVKGKLHREFWRRLGFLSSEIKSTLQKKKNIWVHAVSVGEVMAVMKLVESLQEKFPDCQIILSTVTTTGYALAQSKMKDIGPVIYAPLDFSFSVRKYLQVIRPRMYIVAETEIWPNLFSALKKDNVPLVLVNGRLSEKSFDMYFRFNRWTKRILNLVDRCCMQSGADAQRMIELGVPKRRVQVVGNLKFDDSPSSQDFASKNFIFGRKDLIWVAGSTHPGEEQIILEVYKTLSADFPRLKLILAPRHIERSKEVAQLILEAEFHPLRLSNILEEKVQPNSVVLVDTIGQLRSLYSFSRITFVGKSLTVGGGHNIIEPAFFANCILSGPLVENFKDIVQIFQESRAVIIVKDKKELLNKMKAILKNPNKMNAIGKAAKDVIRKYRGATDRTIEIIEEFMSQRYGSG